VSPPEQLKARAGLTVICDLDGVIWLAHQPIPGASDAIGRLREAGCRILFVTNNSFLRREELEAALAAIGIEAEGDVLSSAAAAARLVPAGQRAMVAGGPGIVQALAERDIESVSAHAAASGPVDAVLVGFDRAFDYAALTRAASAVREGARLIGTNDDATYPTPDGPIPGGGALLSAVVTASGVTPTIAGKPHEPMAELVRSILGPLDPASCMVGDRPETDGEFAARLGVRFALVRTGVTTSGIAVRPVPALDTPDLAALVDHLLAEPLTAPA
jgi:HAD superfamily hydrolase (TIGR01450 family)